MTIRCEWVPEADYYRAYHDQEWGVPVFDDRLLFEFLILEGAQAGLSWSTILRKRNHYRKVFDQFDAEKIAAYDQKKVAALLNDPGIVRNRLKVQAAIQNARSYLEICSEYGDFHSYIWQFVEGRPVINRWKSLQEVPASTPQSDAMSKDLKKHGFKFVGSTICYAFMQAVGMVNDHTVNCFRYQEINQIIQNTPKK